MKKILFISIGLALLLSSCGGWYHHGPGYHHSYGGGYCWDAD